MSNDTNVTWHDHQVTRTERENLNGHKGCVVWFTGLSASGKSTVANVLDHKLHAMRMHSAVLDGDNVRHSLNAGPGMLLDTHGETFAKRFGLGFSAIDREENIRRIAEVAALMNEAGVIVITAFISPYRQDRRDAREVIGDERFVEAFVNTPLEVCEARDPKGLYKKARAGEIRQFTGISDAYEAPANPEIELLTANLEPEAAADAVIATLAERGFLR